MKANPSLYLFEITNEASNSKMNMKTFLENAKVIAFGFCSILILVELCDTIKRHITSGFASAGLAGLSFSFSNSDQLHTGLDPTLLIKKICFQLKIFIQLLFRTGRIYTSRRTQSPEWLVREKAQIMFP